MKELLRRHARGLALGALAAAIGLEVALLATAAGLPFAPLAFARVIVDVTPGAVSHFLIDLLQFWAKRFIELGVIAFFLLSGALAGALALRGMHARAAGVAVAPWALSALAAAAFAAREVDPSGTFVDAALGAAGSALALLAMRGALRETSSAGSLRRALFGAGAVAVVAAVGGNVFARVLARGAPVGGEPLRLARAPVVTIPPFAPEDAAFDMTPGLSAQITSNRDFYVVDTALFAKPRVRAEEWRLRVDGLVRRPYELTYDDLLRMDAFEQVQTLECISNPIGGDLISTARWVGVRVADLVERAGGALPEGFDLRMVSVDGYDDSIPLAKALEPTTLVAYGMNGETLPEDHGHPARVLVPNIYGMKNVKWVTRLEVVNYDYRGYWMQRGWSDVAVVLTGSRIDVPSRGVRWSGGPLRIGGIAFAGARGIQQVEVSVDGGATWAEAKLGRTVNDFTWRRWLYDWTPSGPGPAEIVVRSTDGKGVRQLEQPRDTFPAGATGYHRATVNIDRA